MNERLNRFISLLKQIFELDKSDLDFGIYRVMNLRKTQIEEFLTQRLPQMVQETLAPFAQGSKEEIRAQMTQIEENVAAMGMAVDVLPDTAPMKQKYVQLKKQLAEGADLSALETDVYSALYSFFNRYYEDGDFVSKRRYKEGVYAIPYEGEEVKLYWANQDQYYIKTSENFKDYTFVFDGISVHFRLVDATTEQNNNKESKDSKRTFMLFTEDEENYPGLKTFEYNADAGEIVIRFVYDIPADKKKKYAEENYAAITQWLLSLRRAELNPLIAPIPTGKGKETTTLLEKHLKGYVAKNTFDYFIHKDLRGFLTRELDFFIKSEVMHLEDLDTDSEARVETYLAKVKAIKRVGKIIIDFLAQIEDFQKKLWLKKKFVVETNWCITLDKIDESFWAEIICNKAQIDEWIDMYTIDEAEGWSNPPTVDFLRRNLNLIIDTKHFSNTFKYVETHSSELEGKSLYLLRNKSKVGIGFFEAGNFYPDYILWIDTEDKQYISFIDPKGLLHIRSDDPKVEFYKTIKELETRLAPTADGKTVVLNSFIMSGTPASQLRQWWLMERPQREEKNVYTLDNPECVELMIDKILGK